MKSQLLCMHILGYGISALEVNRAHNHILWVTLPVHTCHELLARMSAAGVMLTLEHTQEQGHRRIRALQQFLMSKFPILHFLMERGMGWPGLCFSTHSYSGVEIKAESHWSLIIIHPRLKIGPHKTYFCKQF